RADSLALFVERARAVRADFSLDAGNAPAVARICRRLEGNPLAIELAASQAADMSVGEILESLGSRLDSFSSESPDIPERHRTLHAAVEWSYRLMGEVEQR